MSSYILILLLTTFLNNCPNFPTIADYFLEVLKFYGSVFDPNYLLVMPGKGICYKSEMLQGSELVVFDMFLPEVNAAANVTQFESIRALFARTYEEFVSHTDYEPVLESLLSISKLAN